MDKPDEDLKDILSQASNNNSGVRGFVRSSLIDGKYPKDFLIYFINSDCFGDYEAEYAAYETWQHQQAKVEELQTLYTQQGINMLKMQKRVETLIQKYKDEDRELKLIDEWEQSQIYGLVASELEQALKGDQYDEHRKKAEEAISKGASLTNHRIEL